MAHAALKNCFINFSKISHSLMGGNGEVLLASFIILALEEEQKCPDLCLSHDSGKGSENRVTLL